MGEKAEDGLAHRVIIDTVIIPASFRSDVRQPLLLAVGTGWTVGLFDRIDRSIRACE